MTVQSLGIDIGGSGMKAAVVNVERGELASERERIETPRPATPSAMTDVIAELVERFDDTGPIGCTFPGVVRSQARIETAANLDPSWVGVDAADLFASRVGRRVMMMNDADAAAVAEMRFGAGSAELGLVALVTVGTGLGTALFYRGVLVPNMELGHIEIEGQDAEQLASSRIKDELGLSTAEWAQRFSTYLQRLEQLISPDLFIVGGGISKKFGEFAELLQTRTDVRPAALRNQAGIVGAALAAAEMPTD